MANEANAKQIKGLIAELYALMVEEEGWEPKTSRDYMVLTWANVKELRSDVKSLKGLYDRVIRLESNQNIFAALQGLFTIAVGAIAGYFGRKA